MADNRAVYEGRCRDAECRHRNIQPIGTRSPKLRRFAAATQKNWGLAEECGTLLESLVLVNQRLPQMVRLFKFREGDLHQPIT